MLLMCLIFASFFQMSDAFSLQANKYDLLKKLYFNNAFKTGDFTLKSGQKSSIYIDLRGIISCPDILFYVSEGIWNLIENISFDVLCGVPYAALPIATAVSLLHEKPMIIKRKEAKTYGTKKLIEGIYKRGDRCLIIEDVITTGSSILETIESLEQEGLVIKDIVVCVNREQSGVSLLQSKGYSVHVLLSLSEILNYLSLHENKIEYPYAFEQLSRA